MLQRHPTQADMMERRIHHAFTIYQRTTRHSSPIIFIGILLSVLCLLSPSLPPSSSHSHSHSSSPSSAFITPPPSSFLIGAAAELDHAHDADARYRSESSLLNTEMDDGSSHLPLLTDSTSASSSSSSSLSHPALAINISSSSSSRRLLQYTGVWSCTDWGVCGFYPNCMANRTCTCSGGTCDPSQEPAATGACTCQYTYGLQYGDWSQCSVSCGWGMTTRSASCFRSDGTVVSNLYCGSAVTQRQCTNGDCMEWDVGEWQTCQGSCGTGSQTRSVTCYDSTTARTIDDANCTAVVGAKPLEGQSCPLPHCYEFRQSAWSSCDTTCGSGTQTRTVQCWDTTDDVEADFPSRCTGTMPPTAQACDPANPHCYTWRTGLWSNCSVSCGVGINTRTVECFDETAQQVVADSFCSGEGAKPDSSRPCSPAPPHCYEWDITPWGTCTQTCGMSIRTRAISCNDVTDGTIGVDGSLCGPSPVTSEVCTVPHCYMWMYSEWGPPSVPCGESTSERRVFCYDLTDNVEVADSNCPAGSKPATTQTSTFPHCYAWEAAGWTSCSQSCGLGSQTRPVTCCDKTLNPSGCSAAGESSCTAPKPITTQSCSISNCYQWQIGAYGACSVTCGNGLKTRTYTCYDSTASATVDNAYCQNELPPQTVTSCDAGPCSDNNLKALVPSVGTLTPSFSASTVTYTVQVSSFVSVVALTASAEHPAATVTYTPSYSTTSLSYGTPQTLTVRCTAQDGTIKDYSVKISRDPSTDSLLRALTPSTGSLNPAFVPASTSYTLWVPSSVSSVTFTRTAPLRGSLQSCSWSPDATLDSGSATVATCISVAEDGVTKTPYQITVTRGQSSQSKLATNGLRFQTTGGSALTISPSFTPTSYIYTMTSTLGHIVDTINVFAIRSDSTATLECTVNGGSLIGMGDNVAFPIALQTGDNIINVRSTSQDKSAVSDYYVTIHRQSTVSTLASIDTTASPDAVIQPTFSPTILSYTMTVAYAVSTLGFYISRTNVHSSGAFTIYTSTDSIPSDGVIPAKPIPVGDTACKFKITPEDGSAATTYTVTVHRESHESKVNTLALTPSAGSLSAFSFSSTTTSYSIVASAATSSLTITVNPVYSLGVCRYTHDQVAGSYVNLQNGSPSDPFPLPVGDIELDILCRSEDGLAETLYMFHIHRLSNVATLASLELTAGTSALNLNPAFTPDTTTYSTPDIDASSVSALPTASALGATFAYKWNGASVAGAGAGVAGLTPIVGDNTLLITVTSEDGNVNKAYTISIHRQSSVATLSTLSISGAPILPIFTPETLAYTATVVATVASTSIHAVTTNEFATIGYDLLTGSETAETTTYTAMPSGGTTPSLTLSIGTTKFALKVVPEDGDDVFYYTIDVYRPAAGSKLHQFNVDQPYLPATFDSNTKLYTMTLGPSITTITADTVKADPTSTTTYRFNDGDWTSYSNSIGTLTVPIGDSVLLVRCTAEDASETTQYELRIHRKSSDSTLAFLGVNAGKMSPIFAPATLSYTVPDVANVISTIRISATKNYPLATAQWSYDPVPDAATTGPWNSFVDGSSGDLQLTEGDHKVYVKVIGEDANAANIKYYSIAIHKYSSTSVLNSLTASVGYDGSFSPSTKVYSNTHVPASTTSLDFSVVHHPLATTTYSWRGAAYTTFVSSVSGLPLISGDQTLLVRCLSEDQLYSTTYELDIHRVSTVTSLDKLVTSIGQLNPIVSVSEAATTYTMTVSSTTSSLTFTPFATSGKASLKRATYRTNSSPTTPDYVDVASGNPTGQILLYEGDTTIIVRVIAEDGVSIRDYDLTIHRISLDSRLSGLTLTGSPTPPLSFQPDTLTYSMEFAPAIASTTATPTIRYSPLATATYTYGGTTTPFLSGASFPLSLTTGDNTLTMTVTAEDPLYITTYTIRMHRISDDAKILNFVTIPASAALTPSTPAVGVQQNCDVPNSQLSFAVTPVVSSNLISSMHYAMTFGDQVTSQDPATIFADPSTYPPTTLQLGQSTTWLPLQVGNTFLHVRVIAEDGATTNYYTIMVHRISVNTLLDTLVVTPAGSGLIPAYVKTTRNYAINLPNSISQFTIQGSYDYPIMTSVVMVNTNELGVSDSPVSLANGVASAPINIQVGTNSLSITVSAEDNSVQADYVLSVTRLSIDPSLASLIADPLLYGSVGFLPPFQSSISDYILSIHHDQTYVRLKPTHTYPKSSMKLALYDATGVLSSLTPLISGSFTPNINLPVGNTTVRIYSTAQDPDYTQNYTIIIERISDDPGLAMADFKALDGSQVQLSMLTSTLLPPFGTGFVEYIVGVGNEVHFIEGIANPVYNRADMEWSMTSLSSVPGTPFVYVAHNTFTPPIFLPPGPSTFTFKCFAQDTVTTRDYVFRFSREGDLRRVDFLSLPTRVPIVPSPTFVQGLNVSSVSVPFLTEAVAVDTTFMTAASTTAQITGQAATLVTLVNNTATGELAIPVGDTQIDVSNSADPWKYSLTITRQDHDVSDVSLAVVNGSITHTDPSPSYTYDPYRRSYALSVPFITTRIIITASYATSSSSVTAWVAGSGRAAEPLTSDVGVSLNLQQGLNNLTMLSSLDGTYVWYVTRLPPDVRNATFIAMKADGTLDTTYQLSPLFTVGTQSYSTGLTNEMRNITFRFTFNTPGTVRYGWLQSPIGEFPYFLDPDVEDVVSGSLTAYRPLATDMNYFGCYSTLDGWYIFSVYRGSADVGGITINGYNYDGSVITLTQNPPFMPTKLGPRQIYVKKQTMFYRVTTLFQSPGSIALSLQPGGETATFGDVLSNAPMGPYRIHVGTNELLVDSSKDGVYSYYIEQEPGDVKNITLFTTYQDGIIQEHVCTPDFISGNTSLIHELTVPYRVNRIQLKTNLITPLSAFLVRFIQPTFIPALDNTVNSSYISSDTLSPAVGSEYHPIVGDNAYAVYSRLDGWYYHLIHRRTPDVQSMTLTLNQGQTLNPDAAHNWFHAPTPYDPAVYDYSGSVNFITERITLDLNVNTPSEISMTYTAQGAAPQPWTMSSTSQSYELPLNVGDNELVMSSVSDGIYRWIISRRPPMMQESPIVPQIAGFDRFGNAILGSDGQVQDSPMLPPLYTPVFDSSKPSSLFVGTPQEYALSLSYRVNWITLRSYFLNPSDRNLVQVSNVSFTSMMTGGPTLDSTSALSQNLTSGQPSMRFLLPTEGNAVIELNSKLDGLYRFNIERQKPDLVKLELYGWTQNRAQRILIPLTPNYDPHIREYTLTLPYIIGSFDLECTHVRTDAKYYAINTDNDNRIDADAPVAVASEWMDKIESLQLRAGDWNEVTLYSLLDGQYSLRIYRAMPVLSGMSIRAELLNENFDFNSSRVLLPSVNLKDIKGMKIWLPFVRGQYGYTFHVPFTVDKLAFNIEWDLSVLQDETHDSDVVAHAYGPAQPYAFRFDTGAGTSLSPAFNGTFSADFPLVTGSQPNVVRFVSTLDGNYTLNITRGEGDLIELTLEAESQTPIVPVVPMEEQFPTPTFHHMIATTDVDTYTLSLPWKYTHMRVQCRFSYPASMTLYNTDGVLRNLISDTPSPTLAIIQPDPVTLTTTTSRYLLLSLADGLYHITIYRAAPDLRNVEVWPSFVTCTNSSGYLLNVNLEWNQSPDPSVHISPLFHPAEYSYKVSVLYAVKAVAMKAFCGATWPTVEMSYWIKNSNSLTPGWTAFSCNATVGDAAPDLLLAQGNNTLYVNSSADGLFSFGIFRKPPTLASARFVGHSATTPSFEREYFPNPSFVPGEFDYHIIVPQVVERISFNVTQNENAKLYMRAIDLNRVQYLGLLDAIVLRTEEFPLATGHNLFTLSSEFDGCYTFNVTRLPPPSVSMLEVGLPQPFGTDIDQAALADYSARDINTQIINAVNTSLYTVPAIRGAVTNLTKAAYREFCGCTGDVDGGESLYPDSRLGTPRTFEWFPPFMGGWLGPYTGRVRHSTHAIDWTFEYVNWGMQPFCTLNGVNVTRTSDDANATFTARLDLIIGRNNITCTTSDGVYVFYLTRGDGTWQLPPLPPTIYATEVSSFYRFSNGTASIYDLNVQWVTTQGSIDPSYFPLASGLMLELTHIAEFRYTAPLVFNVTTVYLTFVQYGYDAIEYDLAPIYNITVLPQDELIWSGILPRRFYYSWQLSSTISLLPQLEATNEGGVQVNVYLLDLNSGEVFQQANLTFPGLSAAPQTFQLKSPYTVTNRSCVLRGHVTGPDFWHYRKPKDVPILIQKRQEMVLQGWPATMFVSQAMRLSITPSEAPDSDLTINMTISNGAVLVEDTGDIYGYDYNAGVTTGFKLHFVNGSMEPQWFVIQALPSLVDPSLPIELKFNISGWDWDHYNHILPAHLNILRAAPIKLTGLPSYMRNRDTTNPLTITLSSPPRTSVTVHIHTTGGGSTTPSAITFLSNETSKTFVYHAPYWMPYDDPLMNLTLSVSGLDAGMYSVPEQKTIEVRIQEGDVRSVQFYARGPDGIDVDLSSSAMAPFIPNKLLYEQDFHIAVMDPNIDIPDVKYPEGFDIDTYQRQYKSSSRRLLTITSTREGANVSLAAAAIFLTPGTMYASMDHVDYEGHYSRHVEKLESGALSSYFPLFPGFNYFSLNSSLDGEYRFRFNTSEAADAVPCLTRSKERGYTILDLPQTSFVETRRDLLQEATKDVNITYQPDVQMLFCSTVASVILDGIRLDIWWTNLPRVSQSLSGEVETSWIFLSLMAMYFILAVSAGIAVGRKKMLPQHVTEGFTSAALSIPQPEQNIVHRAGATLIMHSKTFLMSIRFFSLPHLLILMCALRAFDMLLYHSFVDSMSLPVFRLLTSGPHLLLPWIIMAVLQQVRMLMRLEAEGAAVKKGETDNIPTLRIRMNAPSEMSQQADYGTMASEPSQLNDSSDASKKYTVRSTAPRPRTLMQRLSSPHQPLALVLCSSVTFILLGVYGLITFVMGYESATLTERAAISALALLNIVIGLFVMNRVQMERRYNLLASSVNDHEPKDIKHQRSQAYRLMNLVTALWTLAMIILVILIDKSDITSDDYQMFVVPFCVVEAGVYALILYLLHHAIRAERHRLMKRRKWRGGSLSEFGSSMIDDDDDEYGDDDEDDDDDDEDEDEDDEEEEVDDQSGVDALLDSAPFLTANQGPVRSWAVPTMAQTLDKYERLREMLRAAPIWHRHIDDVDLSDQQLDLLLENGHHAGNMHAALSDIQAEAFQFDSCQQLLDELERRRMKAEAFARAQAKLDSDLWSLCNYVNQESQLLHRLKNPDGSSNGQVQFERHHAHAALDYFTRQALENVDPKDEEAVEAAKALAHSNAMSTLKSLNDCARRFDTVDELLAALRDPIPAAAEVADIRRANLRLNECQRVCMYVNDETNLLKPKRGRLLLTLQDAETILNLVTEQTYGAEHAAFLLTGKKPFPHTHVSGKKGRMLKSIRQQQAKHDQPSESECAEPSKQGDHASVEGSPQQSPQASPRSSAHASAQASPRSVGAAPGERDAFDPTDPDAIPMAVISSANLSSISATGASVTSAAPVGADLPADREPIVMDVLGRLKSWNESFLRFDTVEKLVDAFRINQHHDTADEDAYKALLEKEEEEARKKAAEEERLRREKEEEDARRAEAERQRLAMQADADARALREKEENERRIAERAEAARLADAEAAARRAAEDEAMKARLAQLSAAERAALEAAEAAKAMMAAAEKQRLAVEAALAALLAAQKDAADRAEADKLAAQQALERAALEAAERAKADAEAAAARAEAERQAAAEAAEAARIKAAELEEAERLAKAKTPLEEAVETGSLISEQQLEESLAALAASGRINTLSLQDTNALGNAIAQSVLAQSVLAGKLTLAAAIEQLQKAGAQPELFVAMLSSIRDGCDERRFLAMVREADQQVNVLGSFCGGRSGAELDAFLASHSLSILKPIPPPVRALLRLAAPGSAILATVDAALHGAPAHAGLTHAIGAHLFERHGIAPDANTLASYKALFNRVAPLDDKEAQGRVLSEAYAAWKESGAGPEAFRDLIAKLRDAQIITAEAAKEWRDKKAQEDAAAGLEEDPALSLLESWLDRELDPAQQLDEWRRATFGKSLTEDDLIASLDMLASRGRLHTLDQQDLDAFARTLAQSILDGTLSLASAIEQLQAHGAPPEIISAMLKAVHDGSNDQRLLALVREAESGPKPIGVLQAFCGGRSGAELDAFLASHSLSILKPIPPPVRALLRLAAPGSAILATVDAALHGAPAHAGLTHAIGAHLFERHGIAPDANTLASYKALFNRVAPLDDKEAQGRVLSEAYAAWKESGAGPEAFRDLIAKLRDAQIITAEAAKEWRDKKAQEDAAAGIADDSALILLGSWLDDVVAAERAEAEAKAGLERRAAEEAAKAKAKAEAEAEAKDYDNDSDDSDSGDDEATAASKKARRRARNAARVARVVAKPKTFEDLPVPQTVQPRAIKKVSVGFGSGSGKEHHTAEELRVLRLREIEKKKAAIAAFEAAKARGEAADKEPHPAGSPVAGRRAVAGAAVAHLPPGAGTSIWARLRSNNKGDVAHSGEEPQEGPSAVVVGRAAFAAPASPSSSPATSPANRPAAAPASPTFTSEKSEEDVISTPIYGSSLITPVGRAAPRRLPRGASGSSMLGQVASRPRAGRRG